MHVVRPMPPIHRRRSHIAGNDEARALARSHVQGGQANSVGPLCTGLSNGHIYCNGYAANMVSKKFMQPLNIFRAPLYLHSHYDFDFRTVFLLPGISVKLTIMSDILTKNDLKISLQPIF